MPDSRIPKQVFLGQLAAGKRLQCGPVLRYKDTLKVNLKHCGIDPSALGDDTQDRSAWRTLCHETGAKLWNIKEQFGRGFNLAETSTLGHVTVALASAAPELDSTLINKLTDDKRSVILDGVIRSVPCTANQSNRQLGP